MDHVTTRFATNHTSADDWFGDVARTLARPNLAPVPLLAIDARMGTILGATPTAAALLGGELPQCFTDLVDDGVLARPDADRLLAQAATWRARAQAPVIEAASGWTDQVTIHLPDGPRTVRFSVAHHRRERLGAELLFVALEAEVTAAAGDGQDRPTTPGPLMSLLDREARIVALGPGWEAMWAEPQALIGTLASVLVHPDDLVEAVPAVHPLYAGQVSLVNYTVRMADDDGRWVTLSVEGQALIGGDGRFIVNRNRIVDEVRQLILPDQLTQREFAVVRSLFDGRRTAQIAERHGVSVRTVRNQLASTYRKLGVSGQAELLARFHRPGT